MSPELQNPEDPGKWMEFAWSDLRMAEEGEQSGYRLEALCYLAQQSAEKALKALCISLRIPFLKTHSLEKLLALLPPGLVPPCLQVGRIGMHDAHDRLSLTLTAHTPMHEPREQRGIRLCLFALLAL